VYASLIGSADDLASAPAVFVHEEEERLFVAPFSACTPAPWVAAFPGDDRDGADRKFLLCGKATKEAPPLLLEVAEHIA
jgi:hypothetical protein